MFWLSQLSLKFQFSAWNQLRGSCFLKLWHTSRIFNSLISCWVNYYADYVVSIFTLDNSNWWLVFPSLCFSMLLYILYMFLLPRVFQVFFDSWFSSSLWYFRSKCWWLSYCCHFFYSIYDVLLGTILIHGYFLNKMPGAFTIWLTVTGLMSFNEGWKSICFWYIISFIVN